MKNKLIFSILILFFISTNAQNVLEDTKAASFYALNSCIIYGNNAEKKNYTIGLYYCKEEFYRAMERQKPTGLLKGESYTIKNIKNLDNVTQFDVIIIDESRNFEVPNILNQLSEIAKMNKPLLVITNNFEDKTKICVNFSYKNTSTEPVVEYSLPNCSKFNLLIIEKDLKKKLQNAQDIDLQLELEKTLKQLSEKQKELQAKLKELQEIEKKLAEQKKISDEQQIIINKKQKEIEQQQANLQTLTNQMQQTKIELESQQRKLLDKEKEIQEKQLAILEFESKIQKMQEQFTLQSQIINKQKAEVEKVSREIEQKKKELGNLNNIVRLQRLALVIFGFLFAIIVLLAIWIFNNYKKIKQQNIILEQQKNEIKTQAEELEKINLELEKLSIVASQTSNAVSILNAQGNFEWINAGFTKLYGYNLQLLHNELSSNIFKNKIYEGIENYLKLENDEIKPVVFEHKTQTRNNNTIWIQSVITPIKDHNNKLKQIIIIDSDITEIKLAEQKIAEQNKDIKKSITYASRIQNATLPTIQQIRTYLPQSFVLYLPRDIVSGDFYWIYNLNGKTFFAAADCTGHGVPGAFMSLLGITLLNEVISKLEHQPQLLHPNIILNHLREKVILSLKQSQNDKSSHDGIAMSLCLYDKENQILEFSGAENAMILVRKNELFTYPADEMTISYGIKTMKDFSLTKILVEPNDMIYLFSDGYVDQFGGPHKRKFLIARLRELFIKIAPLDVDEQKNILYQTHLEWKGDNDQIDDIVIFGVKI